MKPSPKPGFLNFKVDHMTLLLQPQMYNVAYVLFRTIFGTTPGDLLYDKRKEWREGEGEKSMTFAMRVGEGVDDPKLTNTIIAVVQPSEPQNQSSHVREMLDGHRAASHWQHIALRTPDLLAFYKHAVERGVNFITPILRDDEENLIQAFTGEWFFPGQPPSGMFFEFLQRQPSEDALMKVQEQNNRLWFRDETFLGLYVEKENEYQSGKVTPFIDFDLFNRIYDLVGSKQVWQITDGEIQRAEEMMLSHAAQKRGQ